MEEAREEAESRDEAQGGLQAHLGGEPELWEKALAPIVDRALPVKILQNSQRQ